MRGEVETQDALPLRVEFPDLDANVGSVAIQSITLQHEGWQRDEEVAEPQKP